MTWSEKALWRELRGLDVNFRRQAPIGRYFADFASHGRKLVIEIDGGVHERLDEVALRDGERQLWLQGEGYTVLRFTDRQVDNDIQGCVDAIKAALAAKETVPSDIAAVEGSRPLMPRGAVCAKALLTPPSPALPPSRRKGA